VFDKKAEKRLRSVLNVIYYIHKLFKKKKTLNKHTHMLREGKAYCWYLRGKTLRGGREFELSKHA